MFGYPLFLDLSGRRCLVFGGGAVALRKIQALLKRGAKVTCVSREFCAPLKRMVGAHLVCARSRHSEPPKAAKNPKPGFFGLRPQNDGRAGTRPAPTLKLKRTKNGRIDVTGAQLVIAATSDREFNTRVARLARRKKIWVNVVDDPGLCDFYVPAVLERGPLQIAISTGGASPLFARRLREELEKVIPVSMGKMLEKLGRIRRSLE